MSSLTSGGSKRCLIRLLHNRPLSPFQHHHYQHYHHHGSSQTSYLANSFSRAYARSPLLVNNLKHKFPRSPSSHSSYCSSSGSSNSKNGFIGWYLGMIESRPIFTKAVSSACIYTFADLSAQVITRKSSDSFDFIRTSRMAGYGLLIMGPGLHFWFNFLSRIIPKRDIPSTLKKMFLGQTVYGPIMTAFFFSVNAGLQGESGAEIAARLKRDLIPTLSTGLMYWPICDFITFRFVPVRLQPLVSNSFAYLWTIYITYMATLEKADPNSVPALDSVSS